MPRADRSPRTGSALLEVLVALVLLAVAGSGMLSLAGQTRQTLRLALLRDRETRDAAAQLDRIALWTRGELRANRGVARRGVFTLDVSEASPNVFDVRLADSTDRATLLRTTLYRPEAIDAATP